MVPQRDPSALEAALRRVLSEPGLAEGMAEQAVRKSPELLWAAVADRYRKIATRLVAAGMAEAAYGNHRSSHIDIPAPRYDHLRALTDAGGLYEHADRVPASGMRLLRRRRGAGTGRRVS